MLTYFFVLRQNFRFRILGNLFNILKSPKQSFLIENF